MDDAHDGPYAREPQVEDLARICRALNDAGARTTKDIDLLVDASPDNIARVKHAFGLLLGQPEVAAHVIDVPQMF